MPRFRKWLEDKIHKNEDHGHFYDGSILSEEDLRLLRESGQLKDETPWKGLLKALEDMDSTEDADLDQIAVIRSILMKLAARYIVLEKHRGKPLDGVARFHVSNGALAHRVNFAADLSRKGLQNSFGMMMNYQYDLEQVKENQKTFEADYHIPASADVLKWLPVESTPTNSKL
jgi:malonyl-CoA decarboxylase